MSQKIAYVTGCMGGIGTAICQRLFKDGFKVIAGCGPTRDHAKWIAEQAALGYTFYASVGNVGDWDSTVEAFTKARAEHGTIDVLVNNAGITRDRVFLKMTREDWDAVIDTNLNSMFNVTKQVVPGMVEKGWGRIIQISSVNGNKGQAGQRFRIGLAVDELVGREHDGVALLLRDGERGDFVLELAGVLRGSGLLLAGQRQRILRLAADAVLLGHVLSGDAHVVLVVDVP